MDTHARAQERGTNIDFDIEVARESAKFTCASVQLYSIRIKKETRELKFPSLKENQRFSRRPLTALPWGGEREREREREKEREREREKEREVGGRAKGQVSFLHAETLT